MPDKNNTPQQPPLHFLLDVIILEVKNAKRTHKFLCDVFAKANSVVPWPNAMEQPPQGSTLTPDGMHAIFRLGNTRIQFTTATHPESYVPQHNASIGVLVKAIEKVKKVLDEHNVKYALGEFKNLPGCPKWIQFRDDDGYTWNISELVHR